MTFARLLPIAILAVTIPSFAASADSLSATTNDLLTQKESTPPRWSPVAQASQECMFGPLCHDGPAPQCDGKTCYSENDCWPMEINETCVCDKGQEPPIFEDGLRAGICTHN